MTDEPRRLSRHSVSDALLGEQRRVRGSRAAVVRALTGRRMRRRVVPPLAIGSLVVMGTAAAGTWVHGIVEPANTGLVSTQQPADPSAAIQQATLDQLRQQIAADEATLAALKVAKSQVASAQAAQAAQQVRAAQQAPAVGGGKAAARPTQPTKAAAAQPKPAVAAAPAAKPAPTKAAPPPPPPVVHATSGASGGRG